ncbi:MAG TPA: DUF4442 domain-containing protein, partial [Puia sp.]|nr:DUF4442 domain-containing protein [Puia sp.]
MDVEPIRWAKRPAIFRIFLLFQIPSAFFSGIKIRQLDEDECIVSVPFKWFTRNPFRSTYFACLGMAAEMSTGALCLASIQRKKASVSMLVTHVETHYFKKAIGTTFFSCKEGLQIDEVIERVISENKPLTVTAHSIGHNKAGEIVA